ncbi:non-canonical purine NTP pyrophosphatase [Patescibacteria group bacterium]|nr:non-canonical purine NTP pyrophosphatase [Patescibacteria group bacterium]
MALYFITGNKGKLVEVQSILGNVEGLDIDIPEIQDIDANKIIKAKLIEAQKHHAGEFIVEDNSLYLEALNGLPGPLIKWFMKTIGNLGLHRLAESFGNFKAEAKVIIGFSDSNKNISFFEGSIRGTIVSPRGEGFGWDPIFQPEGYSETFGEMSAEEKNKISMRKIAVEKLREFLNK